MPPYNLTMSKPASTTLGKYLDAIQDDVLQMIQRPTTTPHSGAYTRLLRCNGD